MQEGIKKLLDYEPETGVFRWRGKSGVSAGRRAGRRNHGYIKIIIDNRDYMAHRLAWLYVYGVWPTQIDHINGDKYDNRIVNLREVTSSQNQANAKLRSDNKVGMRGIHWSSLRSKWRALVFRDGKYVARGWFDDLEEAKAFIISNHLKAHGEYSALNRSSGDG